MIINISAHPKMSCMHDLTITFHRRGVTVTESQVREAENEYIQIKVGVSGDGTDITRIEVVYVNADLRIQEELSNDTVFQSATLSMRGSGEHFLHRVQEYAGSLSPDDIAIINQEYGAWIQDGTFLDAVVAGLGAYLGFIFMNENGIFANQMPFQFTLPCAVHTGNAVNSNMFEYASLPLTALAKAATGPLREFAVFVESFINIWTPLFSPGPTISNAIQSRLTLEIISGYASHVNSKFAEIQRQHAELLEYQDCIHKRCDDAVARTQRDLANLVMSTQESLHEMQAQALREIKAQALISAQAEIKSPAQPVTLSQAQPEIKALTPVPTPVVTPKVMHAAPHVNLIRKQAPKTFNIRLARKI